MSTCDRCFDGRHVRCTSKGSCGCNVCGSERDPMRKMVRRSCAARGDASRTTPRRVRGRRGPVPHMSPAQVRCAQIMRATGGTDREISAALNVPRTTMRRALDRKAA